MYKILIMEDNTILEGGKLIAEFHGGRYNSKRDVIIYDTDTMYHFAQKINAISVKVEYLQYHISWDWLMPVVDKIESFGYCVFIQNDCCWIKVGRAGMEMPYISHLSNTKIESVYKACLELIKIEKLNHNGK